MLKKIFKNEEISKIEDFFTREEKIKMDGLAELQRKELEKSRKKDLEDLEKKHKAIKERHRKFVESRGFDYKGSNHNPKKDVRETGCYNCKSSINNDFFEECNSCGWIICLCGACGCGYKQ